MTTGTERRIRRAARGATTATVRSAVQRQVMPFRFTVGHLDLCEQLLADAETQSPRRPRAAKAEASPRMSVYWSKAPATASAHADRSTDEQRDDRDAERRGSPEDRAGWQAVSRALDGITEMAASADSERYYGGVLSAVYAEQPDSLNKESVGRAEEAAGYTASKNRAKTRRLPEVHSRRRGLP